MSCDAVAFSAMLFMASFSPDAGAERGLIVPIAAPAPPSSVATEPLFADIVSKAGALKAEVERLRTAGLDASVTDQPGYAAFKTRIQALAELDMQGHLTLAARGTDGDLKCILKGISQDLGMRLQQLESAATPAARDQALKDMSYLLNDNVEVITAPPAAPV